MIFRHDNGLAASCAIQGPRLFRIDQVSVQNDDGSAVDGALAVHRPLVSLHLLKVASQATAPTRASSVLYSGL